MRIFNRAKKEKIEADVVQEDHIQQTWDMLYSLRKKMISNKGKFSGFERISKSEYVARHDELIHQVEILWSMYSVMISDEVDW